MPVKAWRVLLVVLVLGIGLLAWSYWTAVSEPLVRRAEVHVPLNGKAHDNVTLLLISDIHVAGPDMPPERLARIVQQANRLHPDAILIAGDFISDKRVSTRQYTLPEAVAPLRQLQSKLGTFAVLGNHDHWRDAAAARSALRRANVQVLDNSAAQVGPLVIGGLDDAFTHHEDLQTTLRAMAKLRGTPVLLSHSPDPFPLVPTGVRLMVAGHTHCGQIRLPLIGAISSMSDYGDRYACGLIREGGRTLIVSAGLGTSLLPLRLGAVPDIWMITLKR